MEEGGYAWRQGLAIALELSMKTIVALNLQ